MEKRRLLFVDDDQHILDALRRMLHSLRNNFDLFFAVSSRDALELLEKDEFDIVVSDMRMPGMDGANLLTLVQEKYPHSIRIMLTGQADDESTLRTIGVVHQFLAKPCDPKKLKTILIRASALHKLMTDGSIKNIISSIDTLPSLPSVYGKLQKKLRDPEVSLDDIGEIIGQDIAMTAKILQLVNSSFFGLYTSVESPARAVALIGIDTIKALVLISQIFSEMNIPKDLFSIQTLWEHSTIVGTLAKMIAERETDEKDIISNSYISGVLHDIGKLILISKLESSYRDAIAMARMDKIPLGEAERSVLKSTHCEMGAYLLGLWGFTSDIVEAAGFHYQLEKYPGRQFSAALSVHIANVAYYKFHPEEVTGAAPEFNEEYLRQVGMIENLQKWQDLCLSHMEQHNHKQI